MTFGFGSEGGLRNELFKQVVCGVRDLKETVKNSLHQPRNGDDPIVGDLELTQVVGEVSELDQFIESPQNFCPEGVVAVMEERSTGDFFSDVGKKFLDELEGYFQLFNPFLELLILPVLLKYNPDLSDRDEQLVTHLLRGGLPTKLTTDPPTDLKNLFLLQTLLSLLRRLLTVEVIFLTGPVLT